jgi:exodeoxyribonuclease-3
MRIITYNVNGIRSATRKGLIGWLAQTDADVVCLQEVKACKEDADCAAIEALGYHIHWFAAEKKGYSGVAILSKAEPDAVFGGDGRMQSDAEGRIIRADFGDLTIINAYFPSGTTGDLRQTYKYQWLDEFREQISILRRARPNLVICGDYNIAHREIDIHNPKSNKDSSGFLPEERAWLDRFFADGFVDAFRHHKGDDPHQYSWWSYRAGARGNNKGWRIDYISLPDSIRDRLKHAEILPDAVHSDHCPVIVDLE